MDGGSRDDTIKVAQSFAVKVIQSSSGRACQLNIGASSATGNTLLFLHADTRLPANFDAMICQALNPASGKLPIAGAFAIKIDAPLPSLRLIEQGVNWRSQWLKMPYGDQAMFLRSSVFHQLGGFPNLPIMEDFELIWRLRRQGQVVIIPTPVLTSARRWLRLGVWQTTIINQLAILAYFLRVPPQQIARWYHRK